MHEIRNRRAENRPNATNQLTNVLILDPSELHGMVGKLYGSVQTDENKRYQRFDSIGYRSCFRVWSTVLFTGRCERG